MSEKSEQKEDDQSSVRVALRIRPQLAREQIDMCQICTAVVPGEPQVMIGKDKAFTFDYVFDIPTKQYEIYDKCVNHLINGCFEGYNATVFAYGQTGSGKTYTMGTGFDVSITEEEVGIIPRAVDHLFNGIEQRRQEALERKEPLPEFKVTAEFIELYNEEILDLLDTTRDPELRGKKSHIKIHEDATGGIYVVGVTTRPLTSPADTMQCLHNGALSRATASTNMNVQSSRSHAIFTIHIKQHRLVHEPTEEEKENGDSTSNELNEFETLTAKFHFVDLAGSERLKRTGATGDRAKEGISINCGLLALGNVISALGDKTKKGSHVPYRDSKLTRLLQDSLGGNSRTLMIACISPSDRDFIETLNTLKYANRARNIKNKVIANQDKASKQMAILRSEIATLQQELLEYKSGKRTIDADGVESINDMFHENTMLQNENEKLRQRLKTLNEAYELLKARNTDLMTEKETFGVLNIAEDARAEEVKNLIQNYIKEIEGLKTKLAETELMYNSVKRRSSVSRTGMSPMSSTPSRMGSSMSINVSMSADNAVAAVLAEAKKDIKSMKKTQRSMSRQGNKEDLNEDEKDRNEGEDDDKEEGTNQEEEESESLSTVPEDEQNGNVVNGDDVTEEEEDESLELSFDDDGDEDEDDDDGDEDDEENKDSENIHEDLAELTCEISIKQKLVEELEQSQRRLQAMKHQYEEKVLQLQQKIKATELERDRVLQNINQMTSSSDDKVKKVKGEFEKKLSDLQSDLKKMQAAKKEHAKLVKNQSHYEKQLKTLQHELEEMKKTKVKLMKQVKEESGKSKQSELLRTKEVARLRKEQLKKDNIIRTLEKENKQREVVLRRKQEEVESLRKRQRPMSAKAAGRVAKYDRPSTIPIAPIPTVSRRRRKDFSPKAAKQKLEVIEKNVSSVVAKKQTILYMERDMNVWLKQREKICKKLEKYTKRRDAAIAAKKDPADIKNLSDTVDTLNLQVQNAQENIMECQSNIMEMEEAKDESETLDMSTLVNSCTLEEARFLLNNVVHILVSKSQAESQKDSENKELLAQLHQTSLNNTLQQDLLKHMINDRVDIEVDNLMTNIDDIDTSASSSSSSPAESMFESQTPPAPAQLPPGLNLGEPFRRDKETRRSLPMRRKTATPEELLYAEAPPGVPAQKLLPLPETPENEKVALREKLLGKDKNETKIETDVTLMPPPRSLPPKVASTSNLQKMVNRQTDPGPSPVLKRKEYVVKPSPDPSPIMRRKNYSTSSLQRSNSVDTSTSSDITPPSSPTATRRRTTGDNVFSRLTSNTQPPNVHPPNRGSIVPNNGKLGATSRSSPVTCTHMAEGHSKAVLAVDATNELLFTSSKDRTAKIWDINTGREIMSLSGHPNNVVSVKYCPQHHLVFTVSQSYISVWDIRTKNHQCIKTLSSSGLTHDGPINFGTSRQIELAPGEHHIHDIVLNEDGTALYSATGGLVRVWDLKSFSAIGKLNGGHQAAIMVLAVDRQQGNDIVVTGSKDHYIKVFEVFEERAGILIPKYNLEPPHYDGIQSLTISGHTLFSGSRDFCIKKWDLQTQQLKQSINSAHKDWVCAMAFIPNSDVLISGCRAGYLKLWNVDNCQPLGEVKAHSLPINAIATNASAVFTASNDHSVGIWRIKQGCDSGETTPSTPTDINLAEVAFAKRPSSLTVC